MNAPQPQATFDMLFTNIINGSQEFTTELFPVK